MEEMKGKGRRVGKTGKEKNTVRARYERVLKQRRAKHIVE